MFFGASVVDIRTHTISWKASLLQSQNIGGRRNLGFFPFVFGKICSLPVPKHTLRLWLVHAHYVPSSINMHVVDWVIIGEWNPRVSGRAPSFVYKPVVLGAALTLGMLTFSSLGLGSLQNCWKHWPFTNRKWESQLNRVTFVILSGCSCWKGKK